MTDIVCRSHGTCPMPEKCGTIGVCQAGMAAFREVLGPYLDKAVADGDKRVYLINPKTNAFVESVNAELIRHGITEWRHPDSCADCAANPAMAAIVQQGEVAVIKATEAMLPFFAGNPDPEVLLALFMSGFVALQDSLSEQQEERNQNG